MNNTPGYGNNKTIDNTLFFPLMADMCVDVSSPILCEPVICVLRHSVLVISANRWTLLGVDVVSNTPVATTLYDLDIINRFEDQLARKRHFRCLFPTPSSVHQYQPLIDVQSDEAKVLYDHVAAKGHRP